MPGTHSDAATGFVTANALQKKYIKEQKSKVNCFESKIKKNININRIDILKKNTKIAVYTFFVSKPRHKLFF